MNLFKKISVKLWDYITLEWHDSQIEVMDEPVLNKAISVPVVTQLTSGDIFYPINRDYNRSLLKNFLVSSVKEGKIIKQTTKPSKANVFIDKDVAQSCSIKTYNYIVTKDGTKYELEPIADILGVSTKSIEEAESRSIKGFEYLGDFYYDQGARLKIIKEAIDSEYLKAKLKQDPIPEDLDKVLSEMVSIEYEFMPFLNPFTEDRLETLAEALENKPRVLRLNDFKKQLFGVKDEPISQSLFSKIDRYVANPNTKHIGVQLLLKYNPYINEFAYKYIKFFYRYKVPSDYPYYEFASNILSDFHNIKDYNKSVQFQNYQLDIIEKKLISTMKYEFMDTTSIKLDRAKIKEKFNQSLIDTEETYKYFYKKEDDRE